MCHVANYELFGVFFPNDIPFPMAAAALSPASSSRPRWRARANLTIGGLIDLVEIREGDALKTLKVDLPETIDLLLLDGAKSIYTEILRLVESRLRPGAFIVADNIDNSPEYAARVRSTENGYVSLPFREDVELSMRIG